MIRVVGAAIMRDGTVLCAQRGSTKSLAGYWEFPGGKIEVHETPQQALQREIEEELRCEITVGHELCTTRYAYDFSTIELTTFLCHLTEGEPHLTEHREVRWLSPNHLHELDWAPADREAVGLLESMPSTVCAVSDFPEAMQS
ncbi:(deoxy)nucleoside triphosphate pyrophosphohydrolase [Bifidobacterium thermophilum]|uniref:(deoxy)nucleoside triphosphate pyrophosphohydrolase n=1 Tax=Bifidobacterium thermophilum TaxID=33905 RepID=UPI002283E56A|nr:(deoxy)nucleoside triphosphate pyrophosphohydrolase [Bifidobacterium thermophilum]MDW8485504.1 (deoxy)nucleoside triphosphate pyrophosphohydrolase [Bifidobacterium thermophilum]